MQAMLLFALFGAIMAAISGIVSTASNSLQQFTRNQVVQTREYFEAAKNVWLNNTVPERMEIPRASCPNSLSFSANDDVKKYLCQSDIAKLAEWSGSEQGTVDPWKTQFDGYVLRKETAIYARSPNFVVYVPVTAMVLVSAGPDRKLATQLQADLAALSTASSIRDVLRISAPDPDTCDVATDGSCDDIVLAFSDKQAQEQRWKAVQGSIDRIGGAAYREYEQQWRQFRQQMLPVISSNVGQFLDASGNLIINDTNINVWQGQGANPPKFDSLDLTSSDERRKLGVDGDFDFVTQSIANGGSGLALTFTTSDSTNGYHDVMTITLSNNGSPWGQSATGGSLSYRKVVQATFQ